MRRVLLAGATALLSLVSYVSVAAATTPALAPATTTSAVTEAAQHQLVPAYFFPSDAHGPNPWHVMCRTLGGGSVAIVSPDSGSGTFRNPAFVEALAYCHAHHQRVIGYVDTDYGKRALHWVLSDIDRYYRWYPVDGIFLDEMSNFSTRAASGGLDVGAYYHRIYVHIKNKASRGRYVVGNPGAPAASPWQLTKPVADNIVVFEDTAHLYEHRSPPAWVLHRPSRQISALVKRTPADQRHRVCTLSRSRNTGWVDVTNTGPWEAWMTLPSYWPSVAPQCR